MFLTMLAAVALQADDWQPVQDRSFRVSGWFCSGDRCEATPRVLAAGVSFSPDPSAAGFDRARHLEKNWAVRFNCAVIRDRLSACRVVDHIDGAAEAERIASALVRRVRLATKRATTRRAIIEVDYQIGEFPDWMYAATPRIITSAPQ